MSIAEILGRSDAIPFSETRGTQMSPDRMVRCSQTQTVVEATEELLSDDSKLESEEPRQSTIQKLLSKSLNQVGQRAAEPRFTVD